MVFYGRKGEPQTAGDFLVGDIFEIAHAEDFLYPRGQGRNRSLELIVKIMTEKADHHRIGIGRIVTGHYLGYPLIIERAGYPCPFEIVLTAIVYRSEKVGGKASPVFQRLAVLPDTEKHILDNILSP